MKVCAYVMTYDTGLAPNPFHGVCTLAVCTPNHQRANLNHGDYIIGIAGARLRNKLGGADQWRLIYAMKVDKVVKLGDYFESAEYKLKIPKLSGSKIEMSGDNFYTRLSNGNLVHTHKTEEHRSKEPGNGIEKQDCDGDRVFIGKYFSYFGSSALIISSNNSWGSKLIRQFKRRSIGITYIFGGKCPDPWNYSDVDEFREYIEANKNKMGCISDPIDFDFWKSERETTSSCSLCL